MPASPSGSWSSRPGITIRDRLRVLLPERRRATTTTSATSIPADLKGGLEQAQIVITNYHAFQLKDAKEIKGVATNTRKLLLQGDRKDDPFKETPQAMVEPRPARPRARTRQQIMVLNDEAHHCYQDKPLAARREGRQGGSRTRNEQARVWFRGLQAIAKHVGHQAVYDLSATPFYLKGSGYNEGYIFPWTVSDFSLMDAIESGIVKVPRIPVDDDADRRRSSPTCACGTTSATELPKRAAKDDGHGLAPAQGARGRAAQPLPQLREGVRALGDASSRSYGETAAGVHRRLPEHRRVQAGLRLDRGRAGRRGRRGRRPQARQARAAVATSSTASRSRGRARS